MRAWRLGMGAGLLLAIVLPLLFPFLEIPAWDYLAINEADLVRLAFLSLQSLLLVLGAVAVAVPLGTVLAVLLFRTDLPLRKIFLAVIMLLLFVPVPIQVSTWQGLFGHLAIWNVAPGRPWTSGLGPAVWVHALAALPWVVLIIGLSLSQVERELEEEALLSARPWRVLCRVTLPRCRGGIAAAALWTSLLTFGDVSATDMFLVSTLAEEMQTEFTMGGPENVARTLRLCWPGLVIVFLFLLWLAPHLHRSLPPLQNPLRPPVRFSLGRRRVLWSATVAALGLLLLAFPLAALIGQLGQAGEPRTWSAEHAWQQLRGVTVLYGGKVMLSLASSAVTGILTAGLALIAAWLARESRAWQCFLLAVTTLSWTLPGPVAGVGLKSLIQVLVEWEPSGIFYDALYYRSSPLPIMWAHLIRFFPFAVAILWPALWLTPVELVEAARLEGARPYQELWHVFFPLAGRAFVGAAAAVTALSVGEVGAAARVETPGWDHFAKLIFDRMHYGVESNVAALCLLLLAMITLVYCGGVVLWRAVVK